MKLGAATLVWALVVGAGAIAEARPPAAGRETGAVVAAPRAERESATRGSESDDDEGPLRPVARAASRAGAAPARARGLQEVDGRRRPGGHVRPHERLRPRPRGEHGPLPGLPRHHPHLLDRRQRDRHDEGAAARQREVQRILLHNRWHSEGDNRLYWTSQKTYGLGTDTRRAPRSTRSTTTSGSTRRPTARSRATPTWGVGFLYSNPRTSTRRTTRRRRRGPPRRTSCTPSSTGSTRSRRPRPASA